MLLMPWLGMLKHRLTSGVSQISASRSFRQPAACRKRLAQYRNWGAEPLETRSLLSGIQSGGGGLGGGLGVV